jgi:tripartite ATP-independent transporter DctP family solute receptor
MRLKATGFALALGLAFSANHAMAETRLHIAHDQPETGTLHILFTEFKRLVEERTKNEVQVRVTCCGTLGDNERTTESVRLGTLDGTAAAVGNLGGYLPKVALLSAPYIIENEDHLAAVVDEKGPVFAEIKAIAEESGEFVLGGVFITGSRSVYNTKRPINTPKDLEGIRMRVMSTDVQMKAWGALGASPTSLAFSEVYTGLMTGVIDAAENSPMFYYNMKHFEQAKYFSLTNHQYSSGLVLFARKSIEKIPEQWRDVVLQASFDATAVSRDYDRKANMEFMEQLKSSGVTINEVKLDEFVSLSRPLHGEIAKSIGAETLLEKIQAAAK